MDAFNLGREIKKIREDLPVVLLAHNMRNLFPLPGGAGSPGIDDIFLW